MNFEVPHTVWVHLLKPLTAYLKYYKLVNTKTSFNLKIESITHLITQTINIYKAVDMTLNYKRANMLN